MTQTATTALAGIRQAAAQGEIWPIVVHTRGALASPTPLGEEWRFVVDLAKGIGDEFGALGAARRLYNETPRTPATAFVLAENLTGAGHAREAVELLTPLEAAGELSANHRFRLTRMMMVAGKFDEAREGLRRLHETSGDSPILWERFAQVTTFVRGGEEIDRMRAMLAQLPESKTAERAALAWALAKAHIDLGDDAAADHYLELRAAANRAQHAFDTALLKESFDNIVLWCGSRTDEKSGAVESSERATFILGPARSGTTLVDQIFSRHPAIKGGGELRHFWLATRPLGDYSAPQIDAYESAMSRQSPLMDPWSIMGQRYLALADERFGMGARFTDKLLSNVYRVRAIRRCLPMARFVYLNRNPVDVAWSCWRAQFDTQSSWNVSQEGVALYVTFYQRAMGAWAKRYPDHISEVSYEELVRNPERQIPKLLDAAGLADDERTRRPELSPRDVSTLSVAQVREPIHAAAVDTASSFPIATKKLRQAVEAAIAEA